MAHTGFCDSRTLLDRDPTAEDMTLLPPRTWASACPPKERWGNCFGPVETFLTAEKHCTWVDWLSNGPVHQHLAGFTVPSAITSSVSSHMLMPGLLKHELEVAMVSLGVIHDRTYAWDIFKDMLWTQRQHTFPSAELPKPYSGKMLAILIDWLIQVHAVLDFAEETLHLTVFLLNRAVRLLKVPVCSLQLLGVVCLFLASKKEECLIPEVSELCHLMENAYTKGQLLKMERKVLCILKFELSYTSPHHFLLLLTTIARCSVKRWGVNETQGHKHRPRTAVCILESTLYVYNMMVWMARYLLELTLLEGECVVCQPVHLAGAAIQLARCVLQEPPLTYIGNSIFLGSEASLLAIMKTLALAAARAPMGNTRATFLKYASEETMCVSKHPALICAVGLLKLPGMQS